MKRPGYGWLTAAGAGLLMLVVLAVLAVVAPWDDEVDPAVTPPATTRPAAPAPVLTAADGSAPSPTADGVREAIHPLVHDDALGPSVSATVLDPVTGERLYRRKADQPTVPASTTKLVTAATVLATHEPADRLVTRVVAGDPGEVVLVGGGDPTLAVDGRAFYPGAARLDRLAGQVRDALGRRDVETVTVDATLFTGDLHGPWDADIPTGGYVAPITALMTDGGRTDPDPDQGHQASQRWEEPDLAAGEAFAGLLGADRDSVDRGTAPAAPTAGPSVGATGGPAVAGDPTGDGWPSAGTELGRVHSPPVVRLVDLMLRSSDNVLAESLARQVALARDEPASFAGAATAMTGVLTELGFELGGSELADGSGLSRDNHLTSALLADLLAAGVAGPLEPTLSTVVAGLPVAGWSGTLADRYRSPAPERVVEGAGLIRAKTGTLNGVHALAGLVVTDDGRPLVFALLADRVAAPQADARELLDRVAAALAGCGCR